MQAETTSAAYRIPAENLGELQSKLAKMSKRADKLGVTAPVLTVGEAEYVAIVKDGVETGEFRVWYGVELQSAPVKIAGWTFRASLAVLEGGVLISHVPGDEQDFSDRRDPDAAVKCDHCNLLRRRLKTYLLSNDDGEIMQVGSSCLIDFLGVDPQDAASWAEVLMSLDDWAGSDWETESGGRREIGARYFMALVHALVHRDGWTPRSAYSGQPTADAAYAQMNKTPDEPQIDVTEADYAAVDAAVEWALNDLAKRDNLSDFDHNLVVAAGCTVVPRKGDGILAYLPVAHARAMQREVELAVRREAAKDSQWVGEPGKRLKGITLTVAGVTPRESTYGVTYITLMHDEAGNRFKWFGSYDLGVGDVVTGDWGVKKHDEWQGAKETVLTRPTKLEIGASA